MVVLDSYIDALDSSDSWDSLANIEN